MAAVLPLTLRLMPALPAPPAAGHMFQPGFSLTQRLVNYAYKGCVFSAIGLGAGLLGTTLSNALLATRKRLHPDFQLQARGSQAGSLVPAPGLCNAWEER